MHGPFSGTGIVPESSAEDLHLAFALDELLHLRLPLGLDGLSLENLLPCPWLEKYLLQS